MPDWLVGVFLVIMTFSLLWVSWALGQVWLNYRVARGVEELEGYARDHLMRVVALWIAQFSLVVLGALSFQVPRSPLVRIISLCSSMVLAFALVGVSWHEYRAVKRIMGK